MTIANYQQAMTTKVSWRAKIREGALSLLAITALLSILYVADFRVREGATHIVSERGDEGVERIKELTQGVGADSVLECVGTQEAMEQAIRATRPGGSVGYVGVPHGVALDGASS